jgi:hypothetical protein
MNRRDFLLASGSAAVDMGVNYFDTAPDYGQSEASIGKYVKDSGNRGKMVIASKFCKRVGYPGHLDADAPQSEYIEAVDGSLKNTPSSLNRISQ